MTQKKEQPVAPEPEGKPLPVQPIEFAAEILDPNITRKLLNAQLAEALHLMRDAGYLYHHGEMEPHERSYFVQHTESMMRASAGIAERIAQLNGSAVPEATKHLRYTVERLEGGGGPRKPENE
jgi:hypothetical protein